KPPCAAGCSRAQGPSGASPARSSARRTPGATDNTSPRSPRSGGLRPPCSGPARPEHRPAAASQRSLQACIASLPLQSSWMSKTYLKSDHFNGGGSALIAGIEGGHTYFNIHNSNFLGGELRTQLLPLGVPVPGPIVGTGLPGLILACGALLTLPRRRRQLVA